MDRLLPLLMVLSAALNVGETPKPSPVPATDCELSWSGHYRNLWGYEVTIPDGRKAYSDSPVAGCGDDMSIMGDHGIVIPLSAEPHEADRDMGISSGYNSGEVRSVGEAADQDIGWIRQRRAVDGTARVLRRTDASLAGLRGIRIAVSYRDKRSGRDVVSDMLEILRPIPTRRHPVANYYVHVYLLSPQANYADDLRAFETFLASVRFSDPQK
jgi:hypothetical protein